MDLLQGKLKIFLILHTGLFLRMQDDTMNTFFHMKQISIFSLEAY